MATDPGTISIPMSSVLDALEGILTEAERAQLFESLIGLRPSGVAPGDLITAELFNSVLSDINGLMVRVSALEGAAGGPAIDHIEPSGDLSAGSKITIVGSNLRPKDEGSFVTFGGVDFADFFSESTDTHAVISVPVSLQGLPSDLPVSMTCNGRKSNAVIRHFVPQVIPLSGVPQVTYRGAAIGEIVIGDEYALEWRVLSQVNAPQTFELSPTISVQSGAATTAAWAANIELQSDSVTLQPSQFVDIVMTVTVPANAGAANIGLRAESSTLASIAGQAPPLAFVVGEVPAVSDPKALVKAAAFVATGDLSKLSVPGEPSGFRVKPSKVNLPLPMQVSTTDQGGGFYLFEASVEPGTPSGGGAPQNNRWTAGSLPAARLQIAGSSTQAFDVPITSSATVDTATVSHILITAKCFATNNSASPLFTSFVRVPITGKS